MGLQQGDILLWKDDPSISVSVISERKVLYNGEETSISSLSAKLKGYHTKLISPGAHWLFNDKLLGDIYDETYPFEEQAISVNILRQTKTAVQKLLTLRLVVKYALWCLYCLRNGYFSCSGFGLATAMQFFTLSASNYEQGWH